MERFTQKLGPLPVWAWAAIGLLAILGYMYWKKTGFFGSGSAPAATGTGTSPANSGGNDLSQLLGNVGLIPNPTAYAGNSNPTDTTAFGPSITTYDTSNTGTPDRGSTQVPVPGWTQSTPATPAGVAGTYGIFPALGTQANTNRVAAGRGAFA